MGDEGVCESYRVDFPFVISTGATRISFASVRKGLNVGRTRMPFEIRFVFPVFSKHEKSGVYVGLVKIVVDAAGFTARGDQQAFQHLANARSLARFCTNVRDHGDNSVHEWVVRDEYFDFEST
jgi:hypothetical protein